MGSQSFFSRLFASFSGAKPSLSARRRSLLPAARLDRFTADWLGMDRTADAITKDNLPRLRARSRELEKSDPYARAFAIALVNNVLGHKGIHLQMKVKETTYQGAKVKEEPDLYANRVIEDARKKFEGKQNYTVTRKLTRRMAQEIILRRTAFDGEIFVWKRKGPQIRNTFKFSTKLIRADVCDHNLNETLSNGNEIRMGVEVDDDMAPVAYYFRSRDPGSWQWDTYACHTGKHIRIPAEEIIHVGIFEDPEQTRCLPWLAAAMLKMRMREGFEEAALINARAGASKMGFFKKLFPDGITDAAQIEELKEGDEGAIIEESEPGTWTELPYGVEPVEWSPQFPNGEFDPFNKAILRSIAASVGMSYMTLSSDLSDANFSSLRAGKNEEQEQWKKLQAWFIECFCEDEFEAWLNAAILNGQCGNLPLSKFDKFNSPRFTGRRWPYVNPVDEMKAHEIALRLNLTSETAIMADQGNDSEETYDQIAADQAAKEARGIKSRELPEPAQQEPETPKEDKPSKSVNAKHLQ